MVLGVVPLRKLANDVSGGFERPSGATPVLAGSDEAIGDAAKNGHDDEDGEHSESLSREVEEPC